MTGSGFSLDLGRCTGCGACVVACTIENRLDPKRTWRQIHTFNPSRHRQAPVLHYSLACNHCQVPACLNGCPAAAFSRDRITGAVLVDPTRCIGCRYCSWVCPYDAPRFDPEAGVMAKCTLCAPRLGDGGEPACVAACPVSALGLLVPCPPRPVATPGFPDTGLEPAIQITPRRRNNTPPVIVGGGPPARLPPPSPAASWDRLRIEWPLLLFSLVASGLVALFTARTAAGQGVGPVGFVGGGALALAVSSLHLGRRGRMWRAVLNLRRSWISREVLLFSLFIAGAGALTAFEEPPAAARWAVAAVGMAALACADMVYRVPGQVVHAVPSSAMTTLTALYLAALLVQEPLFAAAIGAVKLTLYLQRTTPATRGVRLLAAIRIATGFVLPPIAWLLFPAPAAPALVAAIGEIVDRAQFYAELRFMTPRLQLEGDLARVV